MIHLTVTLQGKRQSVQVNSRLLKHKVKDLTDSLPVYFVWIGKGYITSVLVPKLDFVAVTKLSQLGISRITKRLETSGTVFETGLESNIVFV